MGEGGEEEGVGFSWYGWGVGKRGRGYLEVLERDGEKGVLVEVGEDMGLFDEERMEVLDWIEVVEGEVMMGEEG